ncbi:cytochrome P450 [Fennellomyces sp. T-0311]|nr:cytochrome P450 [Fennellomyces sp. T-0311]
MPLLSLLKNRDPVAISAASATVTVILAFLLAYKQRKRIQKQPASFKEIPMPKEHYPIFGHLLSLGPMVSHTMTKWHNELGPIIQLRMGVQRWIVLNDPKMAHEVFVTNGQVASSRPFMSFTYQVYAKGGRGIVFTEAGKSWRNTRKAVLTIFAPKMVDNFRDVIEKEVDYLVDNLRESSNATTNVDPVKYLQLASLNLILTTCFAKRAESIDDELFTTIVKYVEDSVVSNSPMNDVSAFIPALKVLDLFTSRKKNAEGQRLLDIRERVFKTLIKQARESDKKCFIKTLDEIKDELELDDDDILVTMSDLGIAGTDTTSVSLSWAIVLLVNRPEVQKKIQEELDGFMTKHQREPTFDDRSSLPYLAAVQRECLRVRNITHIGMTHVADKDIECRGYIIPKGSAVMGNMHGMHLNPDVYSEPEKFMPERFLDNQATMMASANGKLESRDHFQFGWGRRICPGIYLSEIEMFLALIRIFVNSTIEPPLDAQGRPFMPDDTAAVDSGIVVTPAPYQVRFVDRPSRVLALN